MNDIEMYNNGNYFIQIDKNSDYKNIVFFDSNNNLVDEITIGNHTFYLQEKLGQRNTKNSVLNKSNFLLDFTNDIFLVETDTFYMKENSDGIDLSKGYIEYSILNIKNLNQHKINVFSYYDSSTQIKQRYFGKFYFGISDSFNFSFNVFTDFSISEIILQKYLIVINKDVDFINFLVELNFNNIQEIKEQPLFELYDLSLTLIGQYTLLEVLRLLNDELKEISFSNQNQKRIFLEKWKEGFTTLLIKL